MGQQYPAETGRESRGCSRISDVSCFGRCGLHHGTNHQRGWRVVHVVKEERSTDFDSPWGGRVSLPTTHKASSRLPVGYGLLKARGAIVPSGQDGTGRTALFIR